MALGSFKPRAIALIDRLGYSVHYRRYAFNLSWLLLERFFRMGLGAVVGIYLINYLGPTANGLLNYSAIFLAIAAPITSLGLSGLAVKEILQHPDEENKLLCTAFVLRIVASLIAIVAIAVYSLLSEGEATKYMVILISVAVLFQTVGVVEYHFNAHVRARRMVYAQMISFFLAMGLRVSGMLLGKDVVFFAYTLLLEQVFLALAYLLFYRLDGGRLDLWAYSADIAKKLLRQSGALIITALVVTLYIKIDQYMIAEMLGFKEAGRYSAVVKISELFYFVPAMLCNTLFPAIITGKKMGEVEYKKRLQKLFDLLTWVALGVIIPLVLFSNIIVDLLFSDAYQGLGPTLSIHAIAGLFVFWGSAYSRVLLIEGRNGINTLNTALGCGTNIVLNLILLPRIGIVGAAIATCISYGLAAYASLIFHKFTRKLMPLAFSSLNLNRIIHNLLAKHKPKTFVE